MSCQCKRAKYIKSIFFLQSSLLKRRKEERKYVWWAHGFCFQHLSFFCLSAQTIVDCVNNFHTTQSCCLRFSFRHQLTPHQPRDAADIWGFDCDICPPQPHPTAQHTRAHTTNPPLTFLHRLLFTDDKKTVCFFQTNSKSLSANILLQSANKVKTRSARDSLAGWQSDWDLLRAAAS